VKGGYHYFISGDRPPRPVRFCWDPKAHPVGWRESRFQQAQKEVVLKKIYVGNLSFQTSDQDLEAIFAEFGSITSASVITDRDTGRSRGFGFVEMEDDSAAMNAIQGLNGREVDGRTLNVNEARPRQPRGGSRW
jgi:RNA recognition motif-containing protein